ncbi:MAG: rRNA pseudouridine synthase [Proteobacteria bacterium]|nr:rRNA pseudouridine synthase [Pseudomonadota bacterium]
MSEPVRLSKLMAHRGLCSRREADRYIEQGLVLVDGVVVDVLGTRILPEQNIELKSAAKKAQAARHTILLNKPIAYVSNLPEDGYQAATELIQPENHTGGGDPNLSWVGFAPAGRLDIDSQGLLVLTQDGRVARKLIGADSTIEKEYLIWVEGDMGEDTLDRLREGLSLDGKRLKRAGIKKMDEYHLQFILTEGRKRQIRRMCELVDLRVTRLMRVRIGNVRLENLPVGKWRYLRQDEQF